jgi:hypothetical protein
MFENSDRSNTRLEFVHAPAKEMSFFAVTKDLCLEATGEKLSTAVLQPQSYYSAIATRNKKAMLDILQETGRLAAPIFATSGLPPARDFQDSGVERPNDTSSTSFHANP